MECEGGCGSHCNNYSVLADVPGLRECFASRIFYKHQQQFPLRLPSLSPIFLCCPPSLHFKFCPHNWHERSLPPLCLSSGFLKKIEISASTRGIYSWLMAYWRGGVLTTSRVSPIIESVHTSRHRWGFLATVKLQPCESLLSTHTHTHTITHKDAPLSVKPTALFQRGSRLEAVLAAGLKSDRDNAPSVTRESCDTRWSKVLEGVPFH